MGQGVMGWVAKHGKPLILNDVGSDPRFAYFPKDAEKVASLISVPLIVESRTIGVLTLASDKPKVFTHEHENLLMTLANQAAITIENARLHEQARKRLGEQKVLYRMAQHLASTVDVPTALKFIVNHLSTSFHAKFGSLRLLDESGSHLLVGAFFGLTDEYTKVANENLQMSLDPSTPGGQSPAAVAIREKRICAVSNIQKDRRFAVWREDAGMQDYKSLICIPLIPTDTPIGVLSLYFRDARRLQPDEYDLLQTAARTAAIAIQRAMLDERLLKEEVSRRAIEEVSHLKTEFVSLVSHELRTPLTSIQGYVKLMVAGHAGELNEIQQEFLTTVSRNTDRLIALVSDLLDISRIESGRMELVLEPLVLTEIVDREMESLRAQVEEKDIEVLTDIEPGIPRVKADSHRLGQIVSNLVSNAVKYSPNGSVVKISANQIGMNVLVKVVDAGIGIGPEERGKLFQRFYRGSSDEVRSAWGTGLGLAITRHLVEMHGGKIWVESEKGHGSTFSFSIPAVLDAGS
jgi:signal transduction histidine kinase